MTSVVTSSHVYYRPQDEWAGRLIEASRALLEECGSPSFTAVAVTREGAVHLSPLVSRTMDIARRAAHDLAGAVADATVHLVARQADWKAARWTVWDASAQFRLFTRDETIDAAIGDLYF
ncbi:MAG: hypothetical protein HZB46_02080 [Solirubrobacterales bacterium]|nr:hypothetical protein [Solirubrobacterales bacterium]